MISTGRMDYSKLISESLELAKIDNNLYLLQNENSFVIQIEKKQTYIIKGSKKDIALVELQKEITSHLLDDSYNIGLILFVEYRLVDRVEYTIEVQTFVSGKPLNLDISNDIEVNVVSAVFQLHHRLSMIDSNIYKGQLMSIREFFPEVVKNGKNSIFKEHGLHLLNDKFFTDILNQDSQGIIYGDVWYQNILIDEDGKIGFIDLDPLLIGPEELQFSLMISSFFIYIYVQKNNIENFSLIRLIKLWPTPVDFEKVKLLLYVYPVLLGIIKMSELEHTQNQQRKNILIKSITVLSDILRAINIIIQN